jgi:hypothetical protein
VHHTIPSLSWKKLTYLHPPAQLALLPAHLWPIITRSWFLTAGHGFSLLFSICLAHFVIVSFHNQPHLADFQGLEPYFEVFFLQMFHEIRNVLLLSDIFRNTVTRRCSAHNLDTPIIWSYCCPSKNGLLFPE